ncbi:MAG TPA: sigma 54-interacting transcriptional regulator [Planctomycetota bacterium]|jgi:hypothetical protein|nr:sigma 54-interacting transcriptional regulator [Planctomycetota bacterium]
MIQAPDALEILLPAADDARLRRVRNVVQCLRLLGDDARSARAGAVAVGLDQARSEMANDDRRRVEGALVDLLRHQLGAMATPDTFLAWGEPGLDHAAAWRVLDEFRDELPWLAGLPKPAESVESVARRICESLARLAPSPADVLPWSARLLRFTDGARAAERALRAGLGAKASSPPADRSSSRAGVAVLAECLLDRGAVREARGWLQENASLVEGDPRLRQLLSWTLLSLGDFAAAKSAVVGLAPWSGTLPGSLIELRAHRPEWLPCLAGRAVPARDHGAADRPTRRLLRERSEIGAAVLGVFAFHADGEVHPLVVDAAPALRRGVDAWLLQRDGACAVPGQREHELVASARAVVIHRDGDRPIDGALGREASMALALAPVLDDEGEVVGWLHVECEHHRLPSVDTLAEHAADWHAEIQAHRHGRSTTGGARAAPAGAPWRVATESRSTACAAVFDALVAELAIKTAQRRWWGFEIEGVELRLIASGGEGSGLSPEPTGRGRALTRAISTSSRVGFDEPDPRLSIDAKAASGVVLPLSAGGALCGLLAIESSRRRDFRDVDPERFAAATQRGGLSLRLAQFVGWHRERFGFEVWFDAQRSEFRGFAQDVLAAARSRSPVVLCGPAGAGKTVLARWLHYEGRTGDSVLRVVDCGSPSNVGAVGAWIDSTRGGTLILEDLERLPAEGQEELLRILEAHDGVTAATDSARVLATTRIGLKVATETKALRDDLSHRLDRLQFRLPALRERREDILPLAACLTRRFAREENLPAPTLSDEALALLWRQPWNGNVRELESFVYKIVLVGHRAPGSGAHTVEPPELLDIARRFSLPIARRLPSRHPLRSDLLAALRVTRKPGGRLNKTRAALYLGWDPDTLVARMQDAGIGEDIAEHDRGPDPVPVLDEEHDAAGD